MELAIVLSMLTVTDGIALILIIAAWLVIGWWIEHPGASRPSVTVQMAEYRREWMKEFLAREVRIFDAQIVASLRQGTTWFASTCLISIGGVLAIVGNTGVLEGVAAGLTQQETPELLWQIKLLLVVLFLTNGFLKFVWANRLFGYCAVMMAAVPNTAADPRAEVRARQAAELNIRAAWNFNRGLRSMYFSLGAMAWLIGAYALIAATCAVVWLLWVREFASLSRTIIRGDDP